MPVGELLTRMDVRELRTWEAFERLEPFGERVLQMMVAQLTATVASLASGKAVKIDDLMPKFVAERDEAQDWRVMKKKLMALTQAAEREKAAVQAAAQKRAAVKAAKGA